MKTDGINHGKLINESTKIKKRDAQIDLEQLIELMQRDLKDNGIEQD